jgi:hypothetical protein
MIEPDNLVLIQLRELRAEMKASEERMTERFEKRFDAVEKRLDAMHLNGVKALRGFIGHRSMAERAMASFEDEIAQLRQRVERLEGAPT